MFSRMVWAIVACLLCPVIGQAQYYYYNYDTTISLGADYSRLVMSFRPEVSPETQLKLLDSLPYVTEVIADSLVPDGFLVLSIKQIDAKTYASFCDSIRRLNTIECVEPYYQYGESPMIVTNTIYVSFYDSIEFQAIQDLCGNERTVLTATERSPNNAYAIKNTPATGLSTLELANRFNGLESTEFAHPIFKRSGSLHGYKIYDYYGSRCTHVKRTIGWFNDSTAWDFAGALQRHPIVAVLDDGVKTHEDLGSILAGKDFGGTDGHHIDNDPSPAFGQGHGMACAGLISASHTTSNSGSGDPNSGVISLNPNVVILPVKIVGDNETFVSDDTIALAIDYAVDRGAEVISCSWGLGGSDVQEITKALKRAKDSGRGGKGCVTLFSSGNSGLGYISYPADLPYVESVGALNDSERRWYYSSYSLTHLLGSGSV